MFLVCRTLTCKSAGDRGKNSLFKSLSCSTNHLKDSWNLYRRNLSDMPFKMEYLSEGKHPWLASV